MKNLLGIGEAEAFFSIYLCASCKCLLVGVEFWSRVFVCKSLVLLHYATSRLVLIRLFFRASLQIVTHDKTTVLITASVPSSVTVTITATRAQYLQPTVKYYCSWV